MKKTHHLCLLSSALLLMTSCAEEWNTSFLADKSENQVLREQINQYDVLKSYAGNLHLGAEALTTAISDHSTPATQIVTNFNELTLTDAFSHSALISASGVADTLKATDAIGEVEPTGLSLFGPSLCSPTTTQTSYMNEVTSDTYIPGALTDGEFTVLDFEDMAIGTTIAGSGGTPGEIVEDPMGESGHVYHYTAAFNHPFVNVTLPDGITVGDITEGSCDFLLMGSGWVPASVLKVVINGTTCGGDLGTAATNQGCQKGVWARGQYKLDFSKIEFNDEQKKATSFQLGLGDVCSAPDYYIDNLKIKATYMASGHYEPRPVEDKKADALKALDKYLQVTVGAHGEQIQNWIIASDYLAPGDANDGSILLNSTLDTDKNHYYWNEYLGDNFVADIAKHALAINSSLNLFYSDTHLDQDATKLAHLVKMIDQWNKAGAQLKGINAELHLVYNAATVEANKSAIVQMLKTLAATGLQVRLSGLDMQAVDDSGVARKPSELSIDERKAIADYYNAVISAYKTQVPETQQYGISFANITGNDTCIGLWTSDYNRQATFAGVADGLQSKNTTWNN